MRPTRRFASLASLAALATLTACSADLVTGSDAVAARNGSNVSTPPAASPSAASGGVTTGRVLITLTAPSGAPYGSARGKAKFDSRNGERELEIEAENIPAGTGVTFTVGGVVVGTGTATALREVNLNLNSDRGSVVQTGVNGQVVTVIRTSDNAVIVRGSF